ncbi:MAG: hypothetical protein ABEJ75_04290 [Candidatus Nanohaloarchaea archaeon]
MTLTSNKALVLLIGFLALISLAAGAYGDYGNTFQIQYDSQGEILTQFVAPFAFVYVLLYFLLTKTLQLILMDDDSPWFADRPDVNTEATLMALAITLMLVPTPFWDMIITWINYLGLGLVAAFGLLFLYMLYLMAF